jgi:hypothetical protein
MNRFAACIMTLVLAACSSFPGQPGQSDHASQPPAQAALPSGDRFGSEQLLAYAKRYNELSAEYQKNEYTQVMLGLSGNPKGATIRIKAAIIYSVPASRYRDNIHALALLNELQRENLAEDVISFVAVLKVYVEDRQKLEDNDVKMALKNKAEQRRADDLQKKLDELKNIEKNMIERDHNH